ncbi:hypothetical protein H6P81_013803 [Aristolochia fimbriata]|uniref:Uncharacterized protein n=1 Tax=Aristolochia fimbriata TaxID=158543 RepID=A0AAV7EFR0_ARIFI|nr:hypothetical protein H6P81_013803 [Aristolochia fimbriata]
MGPMVQTGRFIFLAKYAGPIRSNSVTVLNRTPSDRKHAPSSDCNSFVQGFVSSLIVRYFGSREYGEIEPAREEHGEGVCAARDEHGVEHAEPLRDLHRPSQQKVRDDADGATLLPFTDSGDEVAEGGPDGGALGGLVEGELKLGRQAVGVLDAGGKAVVGAGEGELGDGDGGVWRERGGEFGDVEGRGDEGYAGNYLGTPTLEQPGERQERNGVALGHEREQHHVLANLLPHLSAHCNRQTVARCEQSDKESDARKELHL